MTQVTDHKDHSCDRKDALAYHSRRFGNSTEQISLTETRLTPIKSGRGPDTGPRQGHEGNRPYQVSSLMTPTDLQIDKTIQPTVVIPGQRITYTLTFSNAGSSIANGVIITDVMPVSLTNINIISQADVVLTDFSNPPLYSWQAANLAPNQGGVITITGQAPVHITTTLRLTNTAEISSTAADSNATNNQAAVALDVNGWIINEVHADPHSALGDANGDGTVDSGDDEFVELINKSGTTVDISGWTLADNVSSSFAFPAGTTIPDGCAVIVFGGGTPNGEFGGAFVFTDNGSIGSGLNNSGDTVFLRHGSQTIVSYDYGSEGGDNQSLTRNPDITGPDPLVQHLDETSASARYSPGLTLDGELFATACADADLAIAKTVTPVSVAPGDRITYTLTFTNNGDYTARNVIITDVVPVSLSNISTISSGDVALVEVSNPPEYRWQATTLEKNQRGVITITGQAPSPVVTTAYLTNSAQITSTTFDPDLTNNSANADFTIVGWVINEIHADPDNTLGDANGDGIRNASHDEFVELINNSGTTVDISGWTLADSASSSFAFPSGTIVPNGCVLVVFGGGTPTGDFGGAFVFTDNGTIGSGLNNSGDTVLLGDGSQTVVSYSYGNEGNHNQSITRDPDITGASPLVRHQNDAGASTLFSPGQQLDGVPFTTGCTQSNLSLTKTVTPTIATVGDVITYTITFTNTGPHIATGVVLTDALPSALSKVAYSSNLSIIPTDSLTYAWALPNLAINETGIITITGQISNGSSENLANTAIITTTSVDSDTSNNKDTATLSVIAPDITVLGNNLVITNGDTPPTLADTTDFGAVLLPAAAVTQTFTISNSGTAALLLDSVPQVSLSGPTASAFSITTQPGGLIAPKRSDTVTLSFTPSNAGVFTATVIITNSDTTKNPYTFVISGAATFPQADLQVSKARIGNEVVTAGDSITYTITLTNHGPHTVNALMTDTFTGTVTAITDQVSGGGSCLNAGVSPIVCTFANFTGTQVVTLTMKTNAAISHTLINQARINFGSGTVAVDPDLNNNDSRVITAVSIPILSMEKTVQALPSLNAATYHSLITYTVTLTNNSPVAAHTTHLTDTLPITTVRFARFIAANGATENGGIVSWQGSVPASTQISFVYVVTHTGEYGDSFANIAQFNHPPTGQQGSASSTVTIASAPDLGISKRVTPANVIPGDTLTYTITFSNSGESLARGVIITDSIPTELASIAIISHNVRITDTGNLPVYVWQVQDLAPGQQGIITLKGQLSASTQSTITNQVAIDSHSFDSNLNNNHHQAAATITTFDLAIAKQGIRDHNSGTITYTLVVSNKGPASVPEAMIIDSVPISITDVRWICSATGGITCPNLSGVDSLNETTTAFPAGGQLIYTMTGTVSDQSSTITNTAIVTTSNGLGDRDTSNNIATHISQPELAISPHYLPIIIKIAVPFLEIE
ncbi:MAG: lamin tail domain-containing protein [Chloroflexota bacterium]